MAKIIIHQEKCKGCLLCVNFCPRKLIRKSAKLSKQGTNFVEFIAGGQCLGCSQCALVCPDCCIEVIK
ncbi:MAG: 4Fe-4S dicluster domain-containing protein [Candidatus Omnitrophica bacterium]|nr:4Fe-4S dicluster domain-containing protein [Candidatus Omnitrophota bacterium]